MSRIARHPAATRSRGRPKASALPRAEQLRRAKRAQRARARSLGLVDYQMRLPQEEAERLKAGVRQADFARRLKAFLRETVIAVDDYENLKALCWNRSERYLAAEEAFRVYERNWRHVDRKRLSDAERALIASLKDRYGNGVLNV